MKTDFKTFKVEAKGCVASPRLAPAQLIKNMAQQGQTFYPY